MEMVTPRQEPEMEACSTRQRAMGGKDGVPRDGLPSRCKATARDAVSMAKGTKDEREVVSQDGERA